MKPLKRLQDFLAFYRDQKEKEKKLPNLHHLQKAQIDIVISTIMIIELKLQEVLDEEAPRPRYDHADDALELINAGRS